MTAIHLFDVPLLVLYTGIGHLGLVLAGGAAAALALVLRRGQWERLDGRVRRVANLVGGAVAGALGLTLLAGLRLKGAGFDPSEPAMLWEWAAVTLAAMGLVVAVHAGVGAAAGAALRRHLGTWIPAVQAEQSVDPVKEAVDAFLSLRAATGRLREAEKEATARAGSVADGVAAAEYARAAEDIHRRLLVACELESIAGAAVLRLACGAPVRRVLERRPDAVLERVQGCREGVPPVSRVDEGLAALRIFIRELEVAREELRREGNGEPGSIARRLGMDAGESVKPFEATLGELEASYGRIGHRLEALRLRVSAEADAGTAADAAMALAGRSEAAAPRDAVEVALEVAHAERSATGALSALDREPSRISDVVVRASSALARGTGDDEALADVLRSVQQMMVR